jgi:type IV secretion system protein VirB10
MSNPMSPMSPAASPNQVPQKWGVRRVNNLPLYLLGVAAAIFLVIVALVAMDRANRKHAEESARTSGSANRNASLFAQEIAGEGKEGMIAPAQLERAYDTYPGNPDMPSLPSVPGAPLQETAEAQRIRQLKLQQFEEALRAKTGVSTQIPSRSAQKVPDKPTPAQASTDPTAAYKERLAQLRKSGLVANDDYEESGEMAGQESKPRNDIGEFDNREGRGDRWRLDSKPIPPRSPYAILTTFVIPATLITGINSTLPGQISGQVSQDVYDTATGKYLLIPQGTKLEGAYSSEVAYGQASLFVAWQRLVFPDGKTMDIGAMPGSNSAGYAGFTDEVNNHYMRLFGTAVLMSAISAGVALSQSRNQIAGTFGAPTTSSVLSATLGQQLGRVITQMISKNLNVSPTLEIRPGYRFNVTVTKDMVFAKPYQAFDYRGGNPK